MSGCVQVATPSLARSRRFDIVGKPGHGSTLDVTCGDALCICPEHIYKRPWKMYRPPKPENPLCPYCGDGSWALWKDYKKRSKRTGELVSYRPHMQYLCRGCARTFYGKEFIRDLLPASDPNAVLRHPYIFYFGFLWDTCLPVQQIIRPARCHVRACPMPALNGAGNYCHHHNHFFDYKESMTGNGISWADLWHPTSQSYSPSSEAWSLASEFLTPTDKLDKYLRFIPPRPYAAKLSPAPPATFQREGSRLKMRRGGHGHTSAKTTAGRARARSGNSQGRSDTKEKRWTRETIEVLERQADELLEAASEEHLELRAVPIAEHATLAEHYEIFEPVLTEEEEREQIIEQLARVDMFDSYGIEAKP